MECIIEPLAIADYPAIHALWSATPGVGLSAADSRENIERYLMRNPDMSFKASWNGKPVGAILAGHDGRRGFLHHLAVAPEYRGRGLGRKLVTASIAALSAAGVDKCHLMVFADNAGGQAFWRHLGWQLREDLRLMSIAVPPAPIINT